MSILKIRIVEIAIVVIHILCKAWECVFPQRHWVVLERGTDARDNGYWFYTYLKNNVKNQKVYYFIDKGSADYEKVKDDAVGFGSLKSVWLLFGAKRIISTHYSSSLPIYSSKLFRLLGLHKRFYFLQHGITLNNVQSLNHKNAPMRLFVCGAKPEYDFIKKCFGHPEGVVQYTGLARFDQLHDFKTKKQILVMPTWRMYVRDETNFLKSEYYEKWQGFLSNPKLIGTLEKKGIDLVFYVHYEMQPYADHFIAKSNRIKIAKFADFDVQALLKESAVLVTDYSSVFFDFGYMRKPVVYYQFDEDAFFANHYSRGYFDYREMGFGEVCISEDSVVDSLVAVCNREMQATEEYLIRMKEFFPLHDRNNCKRIYEIIAGDRHEK